MFAERSMRWPAPWVMGVADLQYLLKSFQSFLRMECKTGDKVREMSQGARGIAIVNLTRA